MESMSELLCTLCFSLIVHQYLHFKFSSCQTLTQQETISASATTTIREQMSQECTSRGGKAEAKTGLQHSFYLLALPSSIVMLMQLHCSPYSLFYSWSRGAVTHDWRQEQAKPLFCCIWGSNLKSLTDIGTSFLYKKQGFRKNPPPKYCTA